jgi:hypothetical protein
MPLYVPIGLFLHLTFDWWGRLGDSHGIGKVIFFILIPVYVPLALIFNLTFDWWAKLAE